MKIKLVKEDLNEVILPTIKLEFQKYEIDNILDALNERIIKERRNCKWAKQSSGQYNYTDNKKCKQLYFTIKSIKQQLNLK